VVFSALKALGSLSSFDVTAQRAVAVGGVERVLDALTEHRQNYEVQIQGLDALRFLLYRKEGVRRALAAGGIDCVLSTLRAHKKNLEVQVPSFNPFCMFLLTLS
jgi:hypothetical protein